jgi:hypothetical protein
MEGIIEENSGLLPIRDEVDGVYRCLNCLWEVVDGDCSWCESSYPVLSFLNVSDTWNDSASEHDTESSGLSESRLQDEDDDRGNGDDVESGHDSRESTATILKLSSGNRMAVKAVLTNDARNSDSDTIQANTLGQLQGLEPLSNEQQLQDTKTQLDEGSGEGSKVTGFVHKRWNHTVFVKNIDDERLEVHVSTQNLERLLEEARKETEQLKVKMDLESNEKNKRIEELEATANEQRKRLRSVRIAIEDSNELPRKQWESPSVGDRGVENQWESPTVGNRVFENQW